MNGSAPCTIFVEGQWVAATLEVVACSPAMSFVFVSACRADTGECLELELGRQELDAGPLLVSVEGSRVRLDEACCAWLRSEGERRLAAYEPSATLLRLRAQLADAPTRAEAVRQLAAAVLGVQPGGRELAAELADEVWALLPHLDAETRQLALSCLWKSLPDREELAAAHPRWEALVTADQEISLVSEDELMASVLCAFPDPFELPGGRSMQWSFQYLDHSVVHRATVRELSSQQVLEDRERMVPLGFPVRLSTGKFRRWRRFVRQHAPRFEEALELLRARSIQSEADLERGLADEAWRQRRVAASELAQLIEDHGYPSGQEGAAIAAMVRALEDQEDHRAALQELPARLADLSPWTLERWAVELCQALAALSSTWEGRWERAYVLRAAAVLHQQAPDVVGRHLPDAVAALRREHPPGDYTEEHWDGQLELICAPCQVDLEVLLVAPVEWVQAHAEELFDGLWTEWSAQGWSDFALGLAEVLRRLPDAERVLRDHVATLDADLQGVRLRLLDGSQGLFGP